LHDAFGKIGLIDECDLVNDNLLGTSPSIEEKVGRKTFTAFER
jgi:hypothetical protein